MWGYLVALAMRWLIDYQRPGVGLRWIMGYALATYVAVPNLGLFDESTLPGHAARRHVLISSVSIVVYVAAALSLSFYPEIMFPVSMAISIAAFGVGVLGVATWASSGTTMIANGAAFVIATCGSVAAGIILDFWAQELSGHILWPNLILPTVTWLCISASCVAAGLVAARTPGVVSVPFLLNGVLALLAAAIQVRNLFVGVPLFLVGITVHILVRHQLRVRESPANTALEPSAPT
jgi:hypothetical protein